MPLRLDTLGANETLANLQATIVQIEAIGFELVSLARGVVGGAPSNTATFRNRPPGNAPGPLTLVEVAGAIPLPAQSTAVNAGETGGKKLISYAVVLVQGKETNVAAYRG
ncbi:MAG TPA: hypothetical protein VHH73_10535 [Verrucomicrobiae bacterium]|nr:hypothetical protein [Verrucomicrobiae bacterium]